jgi:SAM-dependent methyltransferase
MASDIRYRVAQWGLDRIGRPATGAIQWVPFSSPVFSPMYCSACEDDGPKEPVLSVRGFKLFMCRNCGTHIFDPPPDLDANDVPLEWPIRHYVEVGAGIGSIARHAQWAIGEKERGEFWDVGCGFGFAVDIARRALSWNALGVEPGYFGGVGKKLLNIDLFEGFVADVPASRAKADAILCSEVLEHIQQPVSFLRDLSERMAPGARLLITTPAAELIYTLENEAQLIAMLAPASHFFIPSEAGLRRILERANLVLRDIWIDGLSQIAVVESASEKSTEKLSAAISGADASDLRTRIAGAADTAIKGVAAVSRAVKQSVVGRESQRLRALDSVETEKAYLKLLCNDESCDPMLRLGAMARLLETAGSEGNWGEARHLCEQLSETLECCRAAAKALREGGCRDTIPREAPLAATQMLFASAMMKLNSAGEPEEAERDFLDCATLCQASTDLAADLFVSCFDRRDAALVHAAMSARRAGKLERAKSILEDVFALERPQVSEPWLHRAAQECIEVTYADVGAARSSKLWMNELRERHPRLSSLAIGNSLIDAVTGLK